MITLDDRIDSAQVMGDFKRVFDILLTALIFFFNNSGSNDYLLCESD